ncbi:hypothetical protein CR513_52721, partial [Mucuna pruriens]
METESSYLEFLTNPSKPYFIHGNENPSQPLVGPSLTGPKNKLSFIDGSFSQPSAGNPLFGAWQRCNTMVLAWIHRSISESLLKSILWIWASEVWKDFLKETFFVRKYTNYIRYYVNVLFHVLAVNCYKQAKDYRDQDNVIRFLKGLNDQFVHFTSQIMMIDPLPPITKVFSLVVLQERKLNSQVQMHLVSSSEDFAATNEFDQEGSGQEKQNNGNYRGRDRGFFNRDSGRCSYRNQVGINQLCTHCGMTNLTNDTCYYIHGLPPSYKDIKNS